MAEIITLTTPLAAVTNYRVSELHFNWPGASIQIQLIGPGGEPKSHSYSGATATTLMNQLNVANLSTTSLHRRVINRLVSDGVLAGTVSGSPD